MRIGIIAYSTNTGLGIQTYNFYKYMRPARTLLVDLSQFNLIETHHERFPDARLCSGIPKDSDIDWLLTDIDILFVCETPLNYNLFAEARRRGIKIVQQYNWEFLDYFSKPNLPPPDYLAAPTNWNIGSVKMLNIGKVVSLPVPVDNTLIEARTITQCKTIGHIIGRIGVHDRNGTISFLNAISEIGNKFKYKIYMQIPTDARAKEYFEPVRIALEQAKKVVDFEVIENEPDYTKMYSSVDLMVIPRRYGGLCLPMWESLASGVPVIMTDISPNNDYLPQGWLVETQNIGSFYAHVDVKIYDAITKSLVEKILAFTDNDYMQTSNILAISTANSMGWDIWKQKYLEFFRNVLDGNI